ncbi:hypothetical protein [Paenibacillus roseipurpureus]|uniref:Uncharacterized protein n=1 Tax=Paenibacillus roseopurpureus TaxID=2918901 RepID=A0AA96LLY9_9BACL|nr:hypothetical protein [Paenibacillus sp. MBLB1832]WNR44402.1 hypothetical protein MJB10_25625 [Paenibacillus sp. MBLB1832]
MGGIQGIMGLQSTIGNRAVAQLVRSQARPLPRQSDQVTPAFMQIQLMPTFKSEREAILYFEEWEEDTLFTEHAREVKQLLQIAIRNGWEDLQERIEYAQSESELIAIEQFKTWDLSNDSMLPAALRLLEKAQNKGWEDLEDLVIDYVRKSEDTRDEQYLPWDGLLDIQRDFLRRWAQHSPIPMDLLKKLVLHAGETEKELAWLTMLLQLPIPALTIPQFDLISRYQADLINNGKALRWVLDMIQQTDTLETAEGIIELAKDFNYEIEFALEAVAGSNEYADGVRESEFEKIHQSTEKQKQNVMDLGYAKALEGLTRGQKKDLEKPGTKGMIEQLLKTEQQKFAEPIFGMIDDRAEALQQHVIKVIGPEAYAKRRDDYIAFFQLVNYHPATIPALELCGQNFKMAEIIVQNVVLAPQLMMFIQDDSVTLQTYKRCSNVLSLPVWNTLLTQLTCDEFLGFAGSESCLQLVDLLHTHAVPVLRMKQLAIHPDRLVYCTPQFAADYAQLLVHYTPLEIHQLVKKTPSDGQTVISFLRTLQPKANSAASLLTCLTLAERMRWDQGNLIHIIGALPAGRTALQLTTCMYNQQLTVFDKNTHAEFGKWVNTLCVLMEDQNYTVTVGGSTKLSGNNTYERVCNIYDNLGNFLDDFVVHYHPGAVQNAQHPYGSAAHIKPISGNLATPKIGRDLLQDHLKNLIPKKKD